MIMLKRWWSFWNIVFVFFAIVLFVLPGHLRAQTSCALNPERPYKTPDSSGVYLITVDCQKQAFKNPDIYFSYFDSWKEVTVVAADTLSIVPDHPLPFIPFGPKKSFRPGSLIKTVDNPTVYLKIKNQRYPIVNEVVFKEMGMSFAWVEDVAPAVMDTIPSGNEIEGPQTYPIDLAFTYPNSSRVYVTQRSKEGVAKSYINSFSTLVAIYRIDRLPTFSRDIILPNIIGSSPDPYEEVMGLSRFVLRSTQIPNEDTETLEEETNSSDASSTSTPASSVPFFYSGGGGGGGGGSSSSITIPSAPLSLVATVSTTEILLSWSTPSTNGGASITDYRIEYKAVASSTYSVFSDGTSTAVTTTVTGLIDGVAYNFRVYALNSEGLSPASTAIAATSSDYASAPVSVALTPSSTSIVATWSVPVSNGGTTATDYIIQYSSDGSTFSTFSDGTSSATGTTITGLTNGTEYGIRITAVNNRGTSPNYSTVVSTTPSTTPSQVTSVAASAGNTLTSLSWSAPSNGGNTITDYTIWYKVTASSTYTVFSDGVSTNATTTVTGLVNGTSYDFIVAAINGLGQGASSTAVSATPVSVPGNPDNLSLTASNTIIIVSWSAPTSTGGSAITDYLVEYRSSGGSFTTFADGTSTATGTTITSLTNGTEYGVRISAINASGTSTASSIVSTTPYTVPAPPEGLTGNSTTSTVSLTWTASSTNGSAITDYVVEYKIAASSTYTTFSDGVSSATSTTIIGLIEATSYDFRVSAVNAAGTSSVSTGFTTNTEALPITLASAPQNLIASTTAEGQVLLTWDTPTNTGGASISDYQVEYRNRSTSTYQIFSDGVSSVTSSSLSLSVTSSLYYDFRVSAVNSAGTSSPSTPATNTLVAVLNSYSLGGTANCPSFNTIVPDGNAVDISFDSGYYNSSTSHSRNVRVIMPSTPSARAGAPVVFAYHFNGGNPTDILNSFSASGLPSDEGAIVIAPEAEDSDATFDWFTSIPPTGGGPSGGPTSTSNPDIDLFDDMLSCLHNQYQIDMDRVYALGFSGGGAWAIWLSLFRSNRLAAINVMSNGLERPQFYVQPSSTIPVLVNTGGPTDLLNISGFGGWEYTDGGNVDNYSFYVAGRDFSRIMRRDGHSVIECHHSSGHSIPPDGSSPTSTAYPGGSVYNFYWPFFESHPRQTLLGQAHGPYIPLPASYASLCAGTDITDLVASAGGSGEVDLVWSTPANVSLTDYIVQYRLTNTTSPQFTTFNDGVSTNTTSTVTGLSTGVSYNFQVISVNSSVTTSLSNVTVFTAP